MPPSTISCAMCTLNAELSTCSTLVVYMPAETLSFLQHYKYSLAAGNECIVRIGLTYTVLC